MKCLLSENGNQIRYHTTVKPSKNERRIVSKGILRRGEEPIPTSALRADNGLQKAPIQGPPMPGFQNLAEVSLCDRAAVQMG